MSGFERLINKVIIENDFPFVFVGDIPAYVFASRRPDFIHKDLYKCTRYNNEPLPEKNLFLIEFDSDLHNFERDLSRDCDYIVAGFKILSLKETNHECYLNVFHQLVINEKDCLDENDEYKLSKKIAIAIKMLLESKVTNKMKEIAREYLLEKQKEAFYQLGKALSGTE